MGANEIQYCTNANSFSTSVLPQTS